MEHDYKQIDGDFDEWYDNLTDNQLYFWNKRMNGEIC